MLENYLTNSNKKSFLHLFDIFWSIIKFKDIFLLICHFFCHFLAIFMIYKCKNATFEVKLPKAMIDFDRQIC